MIGIIDYGIGNVRSVLNAFRYIGVDAVLSNDVSLLSEMNGLVLPGVGAFAEGMRRLDEGGYKPLINAHLLKDKPLLGICLGFQMLMRCSSERGFTSGLSLLDYGVVRLPVDICLPHIGWSYVHNIDLSKSSVLLNDIIDQHFYFVHSFGVLLPPNILTAGKAAYGGVDFLAYIESGNIFGTQFHPEKSGEGGLKLLSNFSRICQ